MNTDNLLEAMDRWWNITHAEALCNKEPQQATLLLIERFRELAVQDRPAFSGVIASWLLSDTASKCFDALAVVQTFTLTSALQTLRELESRLTAPSGPEAKFELTNVQRLSLELSETPA